MHISRFTFTVLRACSPLPVSGFWELTNTHINFQSDHYTNSQLSLIFSTSQPRRRIWRSRLAAVSVNHAVTWCQTLQTICVNKPMKTHIYHMGGWVGRVVPVKRAGCSSVEVNPRWWRNFISLTYCSWWHRETEGTERQTGKGETRGGTCLCWSSSQQQAF